MPRWIVTFASFFFIGLAHADHCDDALGDGSKVIDVRNPIDAATAFVREQSPGVRILGTMSEMGDENWHVTIEIDRGAIGARAETYEVIENDDNTCTVRPLWAQG